MTKPLQIGIVSFLLLTCSGTPVVADVGEIVTFSATVTEVLSQETRTLTDDSVVVQQNLKLKATSGELKGQTIESRGIDDIAVIQSQTYTQGDRVFVTQTPGEDGQPVYYVTDHDRRASLYWLAGIFALVVIVIGRWTGLRALVGLMVTFAVILLYVVPTILDGANPLLAAVIGSLGIMAVVVYLGDGWRKKSHVIISSIAASLLLTAGLSLLVSTAARLSGIAEESAFSLLSYTDAQIDFRGLLLAGFLIGTLGVLDDIVLSQIEAIEQLRLANPLLTRRQIFRSAFIIGRTHLSAVVNTLFLAYAGASLPLLLLFSLDQPPFIDVSQVINHELVATEIVRTLVGSIGLALAVPISTAFGAAFLIPKTRPPIKTIAEETSA